MFQPSGLQKLYPHLNFGRVAPPSARQLPQPTPVRSTSVHSNRSQVSEKSVEEKPKSPIKQPPKEEITEKKPPKVEEKKKKVKVVKPSEEVVKPIEPPKPIVKRPNRVKPEPKPEPVRESQIPKKGEQGLQKRYSQEQRKQMYLDRLSRKSVKNAEKEIAQVNQVLDAAEGNPEKLKEIEKEVKGRLKLINYAKYFTQSNINENQKGVEGNKHTSDLSEEPKRSKVSKTPISTQRIDVTSGERRRRSRDRNTRSNHNPRTSDCSSEDAESSTSGEPRSVRSSGDISSTSDSE